MEYSDQPHRQTIDDIIDHSHCEQHQGWPLPQREALAIRRRAVYAALQTGDTAEAAQSFQALSSFYTQQCEYSVSAATADYLGIAKAVVLSHRETPQKPVYVRKSHQAYAHK